MAMNDSLLELNVLGDTIRGGESGSPGEPLTVQLCLSRSSVSHIWAQLGGSLELLQSTPVP